MLSLLDAYQNAARPPQPPATLAERRAMTRAAAATVAETGDRLIERILFWEQLPLSRPILNRLASRLDTISSEIEKWLEAA